MRVEIFTDYRFLTGTAPTGVPKHIEFMTKGLMADDRFDVSCVATKDQIDFRGSLACLPASEIGLSWMLARELWSWTGMPVIDKYLSDADWVYCPKNDWVPVRNKKIRYAVTIHGAHELDKNFMSNDQVKTLRSRFGLARTIQQYKQMFNRADCIFSVSEWLKQFIIDKFKVDEGRIVVVGNGVDDLFYTAGQNRYKIKTSKVPFVLCVGGFNYIDGGDRILKLAKKIKEKHLMMRIKIAGCQNDASQLKDALETGVVDMLGYVDHTDLPNLMAGALALFFPTRYETFGMAAAEAMATGCPVVTSRCTAIPEIVADCGFYVDVENPDKVLEVLQALIDDDNLYQDFSRRSIERSLKYSWHHCVNRLKQALLSE